MDIFCKACNKSLSTKKFIYAIYGELFCNDKCARKVWSVNDLIEAGEKVATRDISIYKGGQQCQKRKKH